MKFIPLHNKVVIERIQKEMKTSSGIILQRSEEPDRAKVLAIGPKVDSVSVGDIVLCDWNKAVKAEDKYIVTDDNIVFIYGE